jgi:general stress protein YciG
MTNTNDSTSKRGFGSLKDQDPERQEEVSGMGGQSQGKEKDDGSGAHDREKAREAGKKGSES